MIGTGLGHYTITGHLGSGGMGEVYQATDARLGRDVAVKFLPETLARDPGRVTRLQREARALAALNHPHIAALFAFEEIAGRHFLVMELVQGTTLATKLARGRLSLDETIRYGTQIADALAAAHARGIVHRDLKPGNIMVTKPGVKVLDFGLAKSSDGDETLTRTEAIMGTPAYMAPEQREGGTCDARSDIYSFGLVLHEMATGRRVADADSMTGLPAQLARVIQGCLEHDPDARWQSAADIRRALGWATASGDAKPRSSSRVAAWAAAMLIAGLVAGAGSAWFLRPAPTAADRVVRFADTQFGPTALTIASANQGADLALTPDGSRYVYVGNNSTQLFVRALDSMEAVPIASGTDLRGPFISPNGQTVGYFDYAHDLRIVPIAGGSPLALPVAANGGATWLDDDTIVATVEGGLRRVLANDPAAPVEWLARPAAGELSYQLPRALPDGRTILFTITLSSGGPDATQVAVFDAWTRRKTIILRGGSDARYVARPLGIPGAASGYLVYVAQGALRAISFDVNRLVTVGQAVPVEARPVATFGGAQFAAAAGVLAYVDAPGSAPGAFQSVVWVDWSSGEETPVGPAGPYSMARLSPDGTRVALAAWEGGEWRIAILDVRSQVSVPLRLDPVRYTGEQPLVWLDDKRIAFQGFTAERPLVAMWAMATDGTGTPELLLDKTNPQLATSVAPDGFLVFNELTSVAKVDVDILRMKLQGSHAVSPLLRTRKWEIGGVVSPDGRWIAYECCIPARPEIWVSPYPNSSAAGWQVSVGGGRRPTWSPAGDQLFFTDPDRSVMRAPVERGGTSWKPVSPGRVLGPEFSRNPWLDVSSDGRRLLTLKPTDAAASQPPRILFVQDWVTELARSRAQ
jgi:serine/threonine-protein kinase